MGKLTEYYAILNGEKLPRGNFLCFANMTRREVKVRINYQAKEKAGNK